MVISTSNRKFINKILSHFLTESSKSVLYFALAAYLNPDIKFLMDIDVQLYRFHTTVEKTDSKVVPNVLKNWFPITEPSISF